MTTILVVLVVANVGAVLFAGSRGITRIKKERAFWRKYDEDRASRLLDAA